MGCGASSELHPMNPGESQLHKHYHQQAAIHNITQRIKERDRDKDSKGSPVKQVDRGPRPEVIKNNNNNTAKLQKMLKEFEARHEQIQTLERTKCFEYNRVILEELEQFANRKLRTNQLFGDCLQRLQNFTADNGLSPDITLREVVANQWIRKTDPSRDDTEMIKLLSTREMLDIAREKIAWNLDSLNSEANKYKTTCEDLQDCYEKRDDLLTSIFGPTYRSEEELKLDRELESLLEERHYIESAKLRWVKASHFLRDAMFNIHSAIDTLEKYENCLENDIDNRFTLIREARNDLHAYSFNIKSMKCILQNLNLPHTRTEDLVRLTAIIDDIFTSTFGNGSVHETLAFLLDLQRQTSVQNKWIKEVLVGTIQRDLKIVRPKCDIKAQELFILRCFLIEKFIKEGTGSGNAPKAKLWHDSPLVELRADSGVDSEELDESIMLSGDDVRVAHRTTANSGTDSELSTTTPLLPGEELGPIPSNSEIFGKIQQLRRQHSQEMEDFEAAQNLNRARAAQALKEKLIDRRSRRYRLEMHRRQLEALQELPQT